MKLVDIPIHESFTNESEKDKFVARLEYLSHENEAVAININEFCLLLEKPHEVLFEPITEREILRTGLYGSIFGMKIYVSRKIPQGCYATELAYSLLK